MFRKQTVTFLTTELRDLHLQLRLTNPSSPFKSGRLTPVDGGAEDPLVSTNQHGSPITISAEDPLVLSDQLGAPVIISTEDPLVLFEAQRLLVSSDTERLVEAHLSGIKTEAAFEDDKYGHGGYSQYGKRVYVCLCVYECQRIVT